VRWKGLIFVVVFISAIFLLGIIFSDSWIESKLEDTGTSFNGARVDIDNLQFSLTQLFIKWDRLQITDPDQTMKNRIETGKCEFDLEFLPLLSNKIIIESFMITDIRTNTDRTEDGAISDDEKFKTPSVFQETADYLKQEVSDVVSPRFSSLKQNANVDSIIKVLDLKSISKIANLQNEIELSYQTWEKKISELKIEDDVKNVETQIKSIDINNIKTADQYYAAVKNVDNIYKTINTTSTELTDIQKSLTKDITNMSSMVTEVDDWIEEDYKRALSLAKIPDINAENISKLIFGERVVNQISSYLGYISTAREYTRTYKSAKPEKQSPPRLKGQDIYFYNKNARPDFWIKKLNLSGYTENNIKLSGLISNIVSDQRQIGDNTKLELKGNNDKGAEVTLNGLFDYLTENPKENFNFQYRGFSLADYKISNSRFLPNKIKRGTGLIASKLALESNQVEGEIAFNGKNLRFDMSLPDRKLNEIEKIIQSALNDISTVNFSAKVRGTSEKLDFLITSNLDEILMNKIGSIVNERFEKAKADIKRRVDSEISKYRADLNKIVSEKQNLLQNELNKYEKLLAVEKNRADEKKEEIEEIYEKEKSKLEDKIKDFFKP